MKIIKLIAAAALLLTAVPAAAAADGRIDMDYNNDRIVDVFDMVSARRSGASAAALEKLSGFLLGKGAGDSAKNGWTLKWSDEFDSGSLDGGKWSYELGNWKLDNNGNYITNGWGNNEQEFYTDKNTTVKDGILTISARRESYTDEK